MNYIDYFPVDERRGGQFGASAAAPYGQWATGGFSAYWGSPADWSGTLTEEVFGLEVIDGEGWLTLRGFMPKVGPMHQLKTLKAIVTRNGKSKAIACRDGHPYALLTVQPHELEVWGSITPAVGASVLFYWRAEYRLVDEVNPNLAETRACIEQREVWWDSNGGWMRGGPAPKEALPFAGATPIPITTTLAGYQCVGLNYGPAWVLGSINDDKKILHAAATSHGWSW